MSKPKAQTQVIFPFGSNIRYLPLVYLIPEDQIVRYPNVLFPDPFFPIIAICRFKGILKFMLFKTV